MNHGARLNRAVRQAGVVWHQCAGCGRDWPFPTGIPKDVNPEMHEWREWQCQVCANVSGRRGLLMRYLQNHCENADAEGMSALCECRLCLETKEALA